MSSACSAASDRTAEALAILAEDIASLPGDRRAWACRARGRERFLTVCNAGRLATAGMGTALAPIYVKAEAGEAVEVFACETRPLLQGARLTAWELADAGIPVTVLPDGAAPSLLAGGRVDAVIVGCDRVAANGDVANKIGTYALAIAARHHGVPFYVAGPCSTLDAATATGAQIEIEQRDGAEVRAVAGLDVADRGLEPCLRRDPRRAHHRPDHRRGRAARAVRARDRGSPLRAAVYLAGGEVRIEERPVPRPGPGEVLVAMRACGICGSDLMDWYTAQKAPAVLGHEPAGVVVESRGPGCRSRARASSSTTTCRAGTATTAAAAARRCARSSRRPGSSRAASPS